VGFGSTLIASVVSLVAFFGMLGPMAQAFSPFIALGLAIILVPIIALLTKSKYYLARQDVDFYKDVETETLTCCICQYEYHKKDMAFCPIYDGSICSLCCSLDARCHDACKILPTSAVK
jgi:hypothetical protein